MSLEVLLNTYGHHHPDYLSDAVQKITQHDSKAKKERNVIQGRNESGAYLVR
jgi:hypothetical protein